MYPQNQWPDVEEETQLLTQLHSSTPTARESLTVRFLPLLMRFLANRFPHVDPELCDTAAADAIFSFIRCPSRFDVNRSRLGAYLRMAAQRDLLNLLEQRQRDQRGISLDFVEEPEECRNEKEEQDELTWNHPVLVAELAVLTPEEQVTLELMREGVRKTAIYVKRLGLEHLSLEEQFETVMRLKDRVKRRLTRAVEGTR